ncbi:hypothetical protein FRC06_002108 [Ceratobasidium sp. 370]|nr:hypothetical protein FRC06_002108 [Ceratobasidium sp. 370]
MSIPSSLVGEDYLGLFEIRGPQIGPLVDLALSPDGTLLISATSRTLLLVDTHTGVPSVLVNTGSTNEITSLAFIHNRRCLVGCENGHIYVVHFGETVLHRSPVVSISYSFQDIQKPIQVMCWDMAHKILAIGYEDGVSIWQSTSKKWRLVDRITIHHEGLPGIHTLQFFGLPNCYLFVGGGFGYATWLAPGKVTFVTHNKDFHRIGNSALSPDGKFLAATTDSSLHIWPLAGARLRLDHLAMSSTGLAAVGTQDGQVAFTRMDCVLADDFYYRTNWSVVGLLAHADRLYMVHMGPVGAIIIVGYTDKEQLMDDFRKFRLSHFARDIFESLLSPEVPKTITIDTSLIPKVTVAGVAMQTGRKDFDSPVSPSRSTSPLHNKSSSRRFMFFAVIAVAAGLIVVLWFEFESECMLGWVRATLGWVCTLNAHVIHIITGLISKFMSPTMVLRFDLD